VAVSSGVVMLFCDRAVMVAVSSGVVMLLTLRLDKGSLWQ